MSFRKERREAPEDTDSDNDSIDSGEGWGLLRRACRYFESGSFQGELQDFRREHAREFEDALEEEGKAGEHTHTIRYSELHAQYLQLVESLLSGFLEEEGRAVEELYSDMKDAKENNYTPLFEEHEYHGFVQSVLDAMEYQSFYRLMLASAATTKREERRSSSRSDSDRGSTTQHSDSESFQHDRPKRSTYRSGDRNGGGRSSLGEDPEHDDGEGVCGRSARK